MLIHNVYFWVREDASDSELKDFSEALSELCAIDEIESSWVGSPAATPEREVTDNSFHTHLLLFFPDQAAHDRYQDHADHHRFVDRCKHLWTQVQVKDSTVG